MHFPATFPVAPVSVVLPLVCSMSSPREVSARRLWWCRFLSSRIFDGVGKPRAMGVVTGEQPDSGRIFTEYRVVPHLGGTRKNCLIWNEAAI